MAHSDSGLPGILFSLLDQVMMIMIMMIMIMEWMRHRSLIADTR